MYGWHLMAGCDFILALRAHEPPRLWPPFSGLWQLYKAGRRHSAITLNPSLSSPKHSQLYPLSGFFFFLFQISWLNSLNLPFVGFLSMCTLASKYGLALCVATAQQAGGLEDKASICLPWSLPVPKIFILSSNPTTENFFLKRFLFIYF